MRLEGRAATGCTAGGQGCPRSPAAETIFLLDSGVTIRGTGGFACGVVLFGALGLTGLRVEDGIAKAVLATSAYKAGVPCSQVQVATTLQPYKISQQRLRTPPLKRLLSALRQTVGLLARWRLASQWLVQLPTSSCRF